jgi:DnaK suppressor protein
MGSRFAQLISPPATVASVTTRAYPASRRPAPSQSAGPGGVWYHGKMTSPPDPRQALEQDRARTVDRLAGLERELGGIIEAAQAANADDEHDPEGATIAFEREHAAALARQARTHLAAVDAALGRLAAGTYGTCARCGDAIAAGRLAARPAAETCIRCAGRPA